MSWIGGIYILIVIGQEVNMLFLVILGFNEFINQTIKTAVAAEEKNVRLSIEAFIQSLRQRSYTVTVSTYDSSL